MADKSAIEWTDATWNPIAGCGIVSPGCTNCYAMALAARLARMIRGSRSYYEGLTQPSNAGPVWTGKVVQAPDHILTAPLRWKRPRRIFVNSMSDLFHESVPDEWIDRVFAVMALSPQHTFQALTKRSKRMREYFAARGGNALLIHWADAFAPGALPITKHEVIARLDPTTTPEHRSLYKAAAPRWPLPNVWLGVTAEDQTRADERIPDLLATPAAKRFVSIEPMLGPVDLTRLSMGESDFEPVAGAGLDGVRRIRFTINSLDGVKSFKWPGLDWIICGGESGPNARPMHPAWPLSLRDQCAAAGVPYFFKQWGEWLHEDDAYDRSLKQIEQGPPADGSEFYRVGKRRAGSLLDGVAHKEFPA